MDVKKKSIIEKIILNKASFKNVKCEKFSYINFLYGNNGTGKSTFSKELSNATCITVRQDTELSKYNIFTFNAEFTKQHFLEDEKVSSIYTVGKPNVENQELINQLKKDIDSAKKDIDTKNKLLSDKKNNLSKLKSDFEESFWTKTKQERVFFKSNIKGMSTKNGLLTKAREYVDKDLFYSNLESLTNKFEIAFGPQGMTYPLLVKSSLTLPNIDVELNTSITTSDSTEFARFVKVMNSASWLAQGHDHYTKDNKCPYCQRELQPDFEEKYKSLFDEEYEKSKKLFQDTFSAYTKIMGEIINVYESNPKNTLNGLDFATYQDKLEILKATLNRNVDKIAKKANDMSIKYTLEPIDDLISNLNSIIDDFNTKIEENNRLVNNKKVAQKECIETVWMYFAYKLKDDLRLYDETYKNLNEQIFADRAELQTIIENNNKCEEELTKLSAEMISAEPAVKAINKLLVSSGFQGFHLEWNESDKGSYQVVYDIKDSTGKFIPATNLSEGERNFISFLYFYHMVIGASAEGQIKPAIVIIDDPVSSMDGQALYIVSSLVKNLVDMCYNNTTLDEPGIIKESHIKQIFVFTHNVHFHTNVTTDYEKFYDCVSFFKINKAKNQSTVKYCVSKNPSTNLEENYNPIKSTYSALWQELNEITSPIAACNIIEQILNYYFIYLCGFNNKQLRNVLLDENNKLVELDETGAKNYDKYNIVRSFLSFLDNGNRIIGNDSYIEDTMDANYFKDILKLIFEIMRHENHYKMMMKI